jgi:hypothetical protein
VLLDLLNVKQLNRPIISADRDITSGNLVVDSVWGAMSWAKLAITSSPINTVIGCSKKIIICYFKDVHLTSR